MTGRASNDDTVGCLVLIALVLIGVLIGVLFGLVWALLYAIAFCLLVAWVAST